MKKILLAFVGMVFFAHLSYATYYRIYRSDRFHANFSNDYANISYTWTEMRNAHVPAPYNSKCWEGGGEGSSSDRVKIYCSLTSYGESGTSDSYHFWSKSRCTDYAREIYQQNTIAYECIKSPNGGSGGDGYLVYSIKRPSSAWWWDTGKGAWVHTLKVREVADSNTDVYEWEGASDSSNGMDLTSTILTANAWVEQMQAHPVPCRDYFGNNIDNKNVRYQKINDSLVAVIKDKCPTQYNNKAFVDYAARQSCRDAISRNGVRAVSEANGSCTLRVNQRYYAVDFNRVYKKSNGTWYGDTVDRSYPSTSYVFRCRNYYNRWIGSREEGLCAGTYRIEYTDASDVHAFTEHDQRITYDVTNAQNEELQHFPSSTRSRLSCSKIHNAGHDGLPGSETVICTCGANKFWSSGNCQAVRKSSGKEMTYYCYHDKTVSGVCAWELRAASNTVKSCNGIARNGDFSNSYLKLDRNGTACTKEHDK